MAALLMGEHYVIQILPFMGNCLVTSCSPPLQALTRLVVICGCMKGSLQTRSGNNILCMGKANYYVDDCSR